MGCGLTLPLVIKGSLLLRLLLYDKRLRETIEKEQIIGFGSWFGEFWSIAGWLHCSQACGKNIIVAKKKMSARLVGDRK